MKAKQGIRALLDLLGIRLSSDKRGVHFSLTPQDRWGMASYRKLYSEVDLQRKPFYNVGAGSFYHPLWQNIDYVCSWYGAVQRAGVIHHDLMGQKSLPIAPSSAKIIYTSHTIEHVQDDAVQQFFRQAHTALEPGGILRVTTGPDAETSFRALMRGDADWFYWDERYASQGTYEAMFTVPPTSASLAERWLHHFASALPPIDKSPSPVKFGEAHILAAIKRLGFPAVLDHFCSMVTFDPQRPGNHVSWWTHDKVIDYLCRAGFATVYRSGFNQSASPVMRHSELFDSTHPQMSIYVEAIKT